MDWNNFEPNDYEPTTPDLSSKTKAQALQEQNKLYIGETTKLTGIKHQSI